jgi:hypothetical protein
VRFVLIAVGGLLLVAGVIWLGQGVGLIGGSFMTGEALWAIIGGACILLGFFLVRIGFRRPRDASLDEED